MLYLFSELRAMPNGHNEKMQFDYTLVIDLDELGLPKRVTVEGEPHEQVAINAAIKTALETAPARSGSTHEPPVYAQQKDQPQARQSVSIPTFKMVVDAFLESYRKDKKPAMFKKHRPVLTMFLEVVGNKPVNDIKQADINKFFSLLHKLPPRWQDECRRRKLTVKQLAELDHPETLGPKSFDDTYKASVRSFLKVAKRDWQDQGFPTTLTTDGNEYQGDREEGENHQRAFTHAELERLFCGMEMQRFAADAALAHCFWLPHIGLFTGARVNEICQLNPQTDIVKDPETGVSYFWITTETEADSRIIKKVKTGDSRKVPIHKKLVELGFLAYVERVKASGSKLIFPAWEPVNSRASGNAEKWFRQFLRDTNLRNETPKAMILGMHAFRYTLLTYGAMQKPPLSLFCISGHAQEEAPIHATGAGKGYLTLSLLSSLNERGALLDQLDYGLNLIKPDVL
jgi:integrase